MQDRFQEKRDDVSAEFNNIQIDTGILGPLQEAYDLLDDDEDEPED